MLREDKAAYFKIGWLKTTLFVTDRHAQSLWLSKEQYEEILNEGEDQAALVGERSGKRWWYFHGRVYWDNEGDLSGADVTALLYDRERKRERKLERAHAAMHVDTALTPRNREAIPQDVKTRVWQRDQGRCTQCGSQERIEFDHIVPLSMGGSSTDRNLQLLCELCNREKGASL